MRRLDLLTDDRVCGRCHRPLSDHKATGRCPECELPQCPRPVRSKPCRGCSRVYTHDDWCEEAEYLYHKDYPGSIEHHATGPYHPRDEDQS